MNPLDKPKKEIDPMAYRRALADALSRRLDVLEAAQDAIKHLKDEARAHGVVWQPFLAAVKLSRLNGEERMTALEDLAKAFEEHHLSLYALDLASQMALDFSKPPELPASQEDNEEMVEIRTVQAA